MTPFRLLVGKPGSVSAVWESMTERLFQLTGPSEETNRELFALSMDWAFPLAGPAHIEFEAVTRQTRRTDFTGDTDSALVISKLFLPEADLMAGVDVVGLHKAVVSGTALRESGSPCIYHAQATAPSTALALLLCMSGIKSAYGI